ncbi:hypothetical protein HY494_01015 [Candidatus Woesearchaeota archaeon]|nr:hypothetical protein [Candidatus Woesearchaeota archaeon]
MTTGYRTNMPSISTDIIIEYNQHGKEGIVMISRKYPPYGLALPAATQKKGYLWKKMLGKKQRKRQI